MAEQPPDAAAAQYWCYESRWGSDDFPAAHSATAYSHKNARAVVWRTPGRMIVGISGSDQFADWYDNFLAQPLVTGGLIAHLGMWSHAAMVAHALRHVQPGRGETVTLCGHSLGGAAALFLPVLDERWGRAIEPDGHIVTFGTPACFRRSEVSYPYADRVTRVVRPMDVVPRLPGPSWIHVGRPVTLGNPHLVAFWQMLGLYHPFKSAMRSIIDWHDSRRYMEEATTCRLPEM